MGLVIRLFVLALLALHLVARNLPEDTWWGVWHYTALAPLIAWLGAVVVASTSLPPVADVILKICRRFWNWLPGKTHRYRWYTVLSVAAAVPFWFLRIRHLRWGDAEFIVKALSYTGPDRPVWTVYNWQSPLTVFSHAQLWFLLNPSTGIGVDTLYAASSVLAGVGFLFVLFLLADRLGRNTTEKVIFFGLVATTGTMELFFGYIENYTLMSLGLLATLLLAVRYMQTGRGLVWVSLALGITNAFHPSTIVIWPAVVFLAWRGDRAGGSKEARSGKPSLGGRWAAVVLPPLLVFAALSLLMLSGGHGPGALLTSDRPGGADAIPFVPLFHVTTEWQRYTMFSGAHMLDWLNEHLLVSPIGLGLLFFLGVAGLGSRLFPRAINPPMEARPAGVDDGADRQINTFLAVAGVAYLLLTFVWNPDYGGRKDWDLFAPSAFVYTLWAAFILVRHSWKKRELPRLAVLLIAFAALHTGAWVYYNTLP